MNPIELLKQRMEGRSLRDLAKAIPCSPAYLSDVMNGNRPPGPKILTFLGLQRIKPQVIYKKARR